MSFLFFCFLHSSSQYYCCKYLSTGTNLLLAVLDHYLWFPSLCIFQDFLLCEYNYRHNTFITLSYDSIYSPAERMEKWNYTARWSTIATRSTMDGLSTWSSSYLNTGWHTIHLISHSCRVTKPSSQQVSWILYSIDPLSMMHHLHSQCRCKLFVYLVHAAREERNNITMLSYSTADLAGRMDGHGDAVQKLTKKREYGSL